MSKKLKRLIPQGGVDVNTDEEKLADCIATFININKNEYFFCSLGSAIHIMAICQDALDKGVDYAVDKENGSQNNSDLRMLYLNPKALSAKRRLKRFFTEEQIKEKIKEIASKL